MLFQQNYFARDWEGNDYLLLRIMITYIWAKVFKNGSSKICGRQPFKNLKWYGLLQADHTD